MHTLGLILLLGADSGCCPTQPTTTYRVEYLPQVRECEEFRLKPVPETRHLEEVRTQSHEQFEIVTRHKLIAREVERVQTLCTYKIITQRDPLTGCETHVLQPVTETRLVRETIYELCPNQEVQGFKTFGLTHEMRTETVNRLELETQRVSKPVKYGVLVPTTIREATCPTKLPQ